MSRNYDYNNYTRSSNTHLLKKSYGDIDVTVIIDKQKVREKDVRNEAIIALMDELGLLLNDPEFEMLLNSHSTS